MQDKKRDYKQFNSDSRGGDTAFDKHEPIQPKPLEVKVFNNFDKAMKHFRSLVQKERTISIYKEKQRYEKPSDKKRRKRSERKRKLLELNSKDDFFSNKEKKEKKERDKEKMAARNTSKAGSS